jgi:sulfotransferase
MKEMIRDIIREEIMRSTAKTYYFMAGLPRSGSTLLSSLLNQNPRFHSGPSSPVVPTIIALEQSLSNDELYLAYPKPAQGAKIISSVLENWYSDVDKPVIFDKNRSWVNRLHYIPGYFGIQPKVLYPVRDISEILASFISMYHRNPYKGEGRIPFLDEMLIKGNIPLSDDNRCEALCNPMGIVGASYNGLKQVYTEGKESQLHIIEYTDLISNPEETMKKIYDFLGEEYYQHNFENIENIHKEKDQEVYGLADMHDVRNTLSKVSVKPEDILSENILQKCKDAEFWRNVKPLTDVDLENLEEANYLDNFSNPPSNASNNETLIG